MRLAPRRGRRHGLAAPVLAAAAMMTACAGGPGVPAEPAVPLRTPYARREALEAASPVLSRVRVPVYGRMEIVCPVSASFDNPFDSSDVRVEARVATPSGGEVVVPAFFYRSFTRRLVGRQEVLEPAGEPEWRVRFTPREPGQHAVHVFVRDRTGEARSRGVSFQAIPGTHPGFVRVSRRDSRYLEHESGRAFFALGANLGWAGSRGTCDYDDWLAALQAAGANTARLWLSPHWATLAQERPGPAAEGRGLGQLDLANCWRLDYLLEQAERRGIYLQLCLDSYNVLRDRDAHPSWEDSPHNAAMGGPLLRPVEFWSSERMAALYRARLRYLAARYAASPHVLAWEFWNEVDLTRGYATEPVRAWHERMAAVLRSLDPYSHPITTSFSRSQGDPAIDRLPAVELVQTHHYGQDLVAAIARESARKRPYGKPHLFGEIGADAGGAQAALDPEGLQVHDPQWAALVTGAAGGALPWWWDNYLAPGGHFARLAPLARFVQDVDFPGEAMRPQEAAAEYPPGAVDRGPRRDLVLEGGPVSWERSEFNRPRTVRVTPAGAAGELPLAGIQHGTRNHPDKHNPVTFELDLPWATRLEVEVSDVSGHGGAALRLTLDGRQVLLQEFPDTDPGPETLRGYAGRYGVELPAGRHTVRVENPGADWFLASFRLRGALEPIAPPLEARALVGRTVALAWAQVEGRTWRRLCMLKEVVPAAQPAVLRISGLARGAWRAEVWDTWRGHVLARHSVRVSGDGQARIPLPAVERDIAVKLRRATSHR